MWSPTHSTHLCRIQEAMTPVYIFACVLFKKCSCATTFMADSIPMIPIWDWDLLLLNIMGSIARRHLELIADDLIFTSNDVELISFETCDCGQVMTNSKWVWWLSRLGWMEIGEGIEKCRACERYYMEVISGDQWHQVVFHIHCYIKKKTSRNWNGLELCWYIITCLMKERVQHNSSCKLMLLQASCEYTCINSILKVFKNNV